MWSIIFLLLSLFCTNVQPIHYNDKLHRDIVESTLQLSNSLRLRYGNLQHLDVHMTSRLMVALRLAGHHTSTIQTDYRYTNTTIIDHLQAHLKNDQLPIGEIANINLAFMALCAKPAGDLSKLLVVSLDSFRQAGVKDFVNYSQYSTVALSICLTKPRSEIAANKVLRQLTVAFPKLNNHIDTSSMIIMALSCFRRKAGNSRLTKWDKLIHKYLGYITTHLRSGKISNVNTKSLMAQAILSLPKKHDPVYYRRHLKTLITDILKRRDVITGSYGDILTDTQVLPILTHRSLLDLSNMECPQERIEQRQRKNISICIKLAVHWQPRDTYIHLLNLTVPENTTALEILHLASQINHVYKYQVKTYSFGSMVTSISDYEQDYQHYWSLYENTIHNLTNSGVDTYKPKNNTCLIFRYQTVYGENKNLET